MLDDNQTEVKPVARAGRVESKINHGVTEALEFALEGAANPDVRYHLREALQFQIAEEHR